MWQYAEDYLRNLRWSFTRHKGPGEPRADFLHANRGQDYRLLWRKYSKYHRETDNYWFGVNYTWLEALEDNQGEVLFMLEGAGYALVPFGQLLVILSNATRGKTDEVKLHMKVSGSKLMLLPVGTKRWEDITSCFGLRDL